MQFSELLTKYTNKEKKERTVGRYWQSEIFAIRKGYVKPEDFFNDEEIELEGCQRIQTGNAMEAHLEDIFSEMDVKFESQKKVELQITEDITLVVKTDFVVGDNMVIETKFPFSHMESIPEKYKDQLEATHRAFPRKTVYLGILEVPFNLRLIPYKPSNRRWESIQGALKSFHEGVVQLQKTKDSGE